MKIKYIKLFFTCFFGLGVLLFFLSTVDGYGLISNRNWEWWDYFLILLLIFGSFFYLAISNRPLTFWKFIIGVVLLPVVIVLSAISYGEYSTFFVLRTAPEQEYSGAIVVVKKKKWRHHGMTYQFTMEFINPEPLSSIDDYKLQFLNELKYDAMDIGDTIDVDIFSKGGIWYFVPPFFDLENNAIRKLRVD